MNRPDGTPADYASGRLIEPDVNGRTPERMGGQLFVADLPERTNTQDALCHDVSRTLAEFGLTAEMHA